MKALLVQELLEKYFDKPVDNKIEKYVNPRNAEKLKSPYGYYDIANSLDIQETIIPELRVEGIRFQYDGYRNFLVVFCKDDEEAKLVGDILEDDGEGDRFDDETIEWHLAENEEMGDAAYIASLINVNDIINYYES